MVLYSISFFFFVGSSKKNAKTAVAKAALSKLLNMNQPPGLQNVPSNILPFGSMSVAQELADHIGT